MDVNGNNGTQQADPTLSRDQMRWLEGVVANAVTMRQTWIRQLLDPRRNVEDECGYPRWSDAVNVEVYRQLYDRMPIANRVVQVLPKECWQVTPLVYEDEDSKHVTEFEEAWDGLSINTGASKSWHQEEQGSTLWDLLIRADILSGIGHFGVLLLGIDDGRNLQDPVEGVKVFNRKAVPIYREQRNWGGRLTTNAQAPHLVRNGDGSLRQFGTRMERVGDGAPAMPDSPPIKAEVDAINAMLEEKSYVIDSPVWNNDKFRTKPKSHPATFLNSPWMAHEDGTNATTDTTDNATSKHGGASYQDAWGSVSSPGVTSDGKSVEQLSGTDKQYAWQGTMPPVALSGTDQQYFGVVMGPSEQLEGPAGGKGKSPARKLVFLRAFDETLVQVVRWEWNVRNPRFGLPVMYRITLNDPRDQHSGVGLPMATVFVHWTRVVHVADNRGSSESFGSPRMRPVLDNLLGLRKIYSGDPEGYWKQAFPLLSIESHPELGADATLDVDAVKDVMERIFSSLQRYIAISGATVKTLPPAVADPTAHITVQLEAICIQLGIPIRVFKGSERGELASSQDDASWNDRLRFRQHTYLTPRLVCPFIDRLIMLGVLPEPEGYTVEWPDLDSLTDKDKAGIALQRVQAYAAYTAGQPEAVITPLDFLVREMGFTEEEAETIIEAAQKATEEKMEDHQDLADEHGFEPEPPPGFHKPEPEPPPELPTPIKVKPGEKLVTPPMPKQVTAARNTTNREAVDAILANADAQQLYDDFISVLEGRG